MRYYMQILAFFILLNVIPPIGCISQEWEWQNPLPTGNRLYCMDFVDSLTGWFGSSAGTILHTSDGGNSWEIQHTGINDLYCEYIDFIDHQEGWLTGREDYGSAYVLHTIDGGKNWIVQLVYMSNTLSIITFKDQKHGWLGTGSGDIFYTVDGGTNWKLSYSGRGVVRSIVFLDTLHGWAEGQGMPLLYTDDGGRSWSADTTGIIGVKVFFSDSLHGWITSREKVLRTMDGGKTWLDDLPKVSDELLKDIFFVDTLSGWVTSGEEGTYRTTDGGWTWEQITTTWPEIEWGGYHFFSPLSGWMGFSRTWDGGKTLVNQKKGFTLFTLWDVDFINENTGWVVGEKGLIAKTTDGGKSCHLQESGTGTRLTNVFALDEMRAWVIGGNLVLKTQNSGETWQFQPYQLGNQPSPQAVTFIDSLKGWIVGGNYNGGGWILHTEDGGDIWEEQIPSIIPELHDITFVNENKGWVVGSKGSIYHTTNGGKNWIPQLENQSHDFHSVCFVNEYVGWAGGTRQIVHTTDGGANWVVQSEGEGIYPRDMFFIDENNGWICGVIGHLFYTSNGGATWQRQYSGTTETLRAIEFIDKDMGWIVGNNGTVLHTTTGGTTGVEMNFTSEYTVQNFYLYTNYPNPFNSHTIILYELPERGQVRLTIYDILGKEVITLVDEVQSSGIHRITWYGQDKKGVDVSSGIYLYHIQFGESFQKTGKMILVR